MLPLRNLTSYNNVAMVNYFLLQNGYEPTDIAVMVAENIKSIGNQPPAYVDKENVDYLNSLKPTFTGENVTVANFEKLLKSETGFGENLIGGARENLLVYFCGRSTNISISIGKEEYSVTRFQTQIRELREKKKYKNMFLVMDSSNAEPYLIKLKIDAQNVYAIAPAFKPKCEDPKQSPFLRYFTMVWKDAMSTYPRARLCEIRDAMGMSLSVVGIGSKDVEEMYVQDFIAIPGDEEVDIPCPCYGQQSCWCSSPSIPVGIPPPPPQLSRYGFPQRNVLYQQPNSVSLGSYGPRVYG